MKDEPVRLFAACGTGPAFPRLLHSLRTLVGDPRFQIFVQRGPLVVGYDDLPGAALVPRKVFSEKLAWADVVICHAGSGTLHQAYCSGHHPLVAPRLPEFGEIVNDHQFELVSALEHKGLATRWREDEPLPDQLRALPERVGARSPQELAKPLAEAVRDALVDSSDSASPYRVGRAIVRRLMEELLRRTHRPKDATSSPDGVHSRCG